VSLDASIWGLEANKRELAIALQPEDERRELYRPEEVKIGSCSTQKGAD